MVATRDMPGDLHVIGLVGQDETGGRVAFQQSSENRGVGRVAANNTMRTELEPIANPGDRNGWIWVERPLLSPSGASPRMTWSISAGEKPVISIGASITINPSNSIFNASRSH